MISNTGKNGIIEKRYVFGVVKMNALRKSIKLLLDQIFERNSEMSEMFECTIKYIISLLNANDKYYTNNRQ